MAVMQNGADANVVVTPKFAPTPQGTDFGGSNGPYIGTLPGSNNGNPYTPSQGAAAPPSAPASGPDTIVTDPGNTVDWTAAIQNQPEYAAAITGNRESEARAAAQRRAALQGQVIQYGGLPQGFKDAYGDIDQATLDAARSNQYSTLSQLQRNYTQSVEQFRKALAARGALQSGDLNYGQDQLDTGYGQQQYDAGNAFGQGATGAINAYTGVLDQNQRDLVNAISQASQSAYANPANRETPQKTANHDAALSATYGVDIYKDPDGTLYTRDGTVFNPANPSAAYGFGGFDANGNWIGT